LNDIYPPLSDGDVHIWSAVLVDTEYENQPYFSLLAPNETRRADAFHFERDRQRFVCGRGIVRHVLSSYAGTPAVELSFHRTKKGKLELPGSGLAFNVAHSESRLVVAVGKTRALGVDVEWVRPLDEREGVMARFFSSAERDYVSAGHGAESSRRFFRCWTRKEAVLKAAGCGLIDGLERMDILCDGIVFDSGEPECQAGAFHLADLKLGEDWRGAVAVLGGKAPISYFTWPRN